MNNILENDIYYVCCMVEYIARKTKNRRGMVVEKLGLDAIGKVYLQCSFEEGRLLA